jgi:hypothetical protein
LADRPRFRQGIDPPGERGNNRSHAQQSRSKLLCVDGSVILRLDPLPTKEARLGPRLKPLADNPVRTAVRLPMRLALHVQTEDGKLEAMTENISANGLLFVSDRLPEIDSRIEFTIEMPSEIMGSPTDVTIHCSGRVVRHQQHGHEKKAAAVIDEYFLKA